ncbi:MULTISPECIES: DNA polymerase III subunit delta [unclassified Sphingobacterium]|uniref:DNA polymerase III subunit delta n=1 Tax=unclassified Sphingobacterium TaxID=2609468 RepID=UPI00143C66F7|nr:MULTISPECIES: DNA polymerase III subunit delta [unclassified Sphingobacterium]MBB2952017.1 DNA polymerase-3 subunit delta [Sphingobacterium sp. JUb56]NJI71648.1 DNA polymerase III subunit delta [Sphingobacterium sp. B16(2022)]
MNISPILTDIKKRKFQPVYLLHGEESYFIDVISDALEHTVLNDAQKGFDQTVLYGKDTDFSTIVNAAKRYPMMSDHQLIIIKEAQDLKWKDDELLLKYVEQCTVSTVLVFDYKYGKFDKRKKLYKAIEKKGLVVESNKLYDDKVAAWVISYIKEQGWNIHPQAAALLSEYLGTELSKIVNELNKLMLNVPKEREIVVADIEQNIGISKDFNVFELNTALAKRNAFKAYQIIDYFAANPKSNPLVLVLGTIAGYFTKILKYHYIIDKSTAAKELGVHPFFMKEYELAARNYNRRKTFTIIEALKDADLKSKGMNVGGNTSTKDILTELIFTILN